MREELIRAVRSGEYRSPKTILGFLGGLVAIAGGTAVGLALALSDIPQLHYVIVGFAGFLVFLVCACVAAVLFFAWKDPSKLQLQQVSPTQYLEIQRQIKGDDKYGEYVEAQGPAVLIDRSDEQSSLSPTLPPHREEDRDDGQ